MTRRGAAKVLHDAYPVRTVARLTGLSADLIRAWERRYGVVHPVRGPRGARLYSAEDVAVLRLLATLVAQGRSIGDISGLDRTALEELVAQQAPPETPSLAPHDRAADVIERVLTALGRFDQSEVERLLGEALLGMGTSAFVRDVGMPVLREAGVRWCDGSLSVAEEHLLSGVLRNLFGGLSRLRAGQHRPTVLLAAPSGERHEFGLLLVALLVLEARLGVVYLGVDLPAEQIVKAAAAAGVSVAGLSLVNGGDDPEMLRQVEIVENGLAPAVELWLGGAAAPDIRRGLTGSRAVVLQTVPEIQANIARILGRGPGDAYHDNALGGMKK